MLMTVTCVIEEEEEIEASVAAAEVVLRTTSKLGAEGLIQVVDCEN